MTGNQPNNFSSIERKQLALKHGLGKIRVLAIGVNTYPPKSGFRNLKNCANDAFQITSTFREVLQLNADPNDITLMTSETTDCLPYRGLILNQIHELADGAMEEDRLFFFFSGHGHRINGFDDHFLVPQDAFSESKADALVSIAEVLQILESSKAKQKIVVLDACLSGPVSLGKKLNAASFSDKFFAQYLASTKGLAILSSSSADEASYEKSPNPKLSLFTFHLIQALRGAPDALDDKILTIPKLFDYVSTLVKRDCNSYRLQQTPSLKTSATGTFVLADFRQPLVVSAVTLKANSFNSLILHESHSERTKSILTDWSNRNKTAEQLEYAINNLGGLTKYFENTFSTWRPLFRRHLGFTSSELETDGSTFSFPGGSLSHRYHAESKDRGCIHSELTLDSDWFNNGPRLISLLSILDFNPHSLEINFTSPLKPLNQIESLEANDWRITNESAHEIVASKNGITMTVAVDSLKFDGFDIKKLFAAAESPNDVQTFFTESLTVLTLPNK
jgi:hypothetical protein